MKGAVAWLRGRACQALLQPPRGRRRGARADRVHWVGGQPASQPALDAPPGQKSDIRTLGSVVNHGY